MRDKVFRQGEPYVSLLIPITHACNLNCFFCCAPDRSTTHDHSPEKVEETLRNFKGEHILFTGGEPTLSPHLPRYIKLANELGLKHSIATNGVRLEDKEFFWSLIDAGLEEVTLPIYGFDDDIYMKMTGRKLVENRHKGFENLLKAGIPISASFTIVRGLNEHELPQIIELAMKNSTSIYQMRIRSVSPAGTLTENKPLMMSEYVDLFSKALDVDPQVMIDHYMSRGPWMEYTVGINHKVPKIPVHFEIDVIGFMREQAAKGNKTCKKYLKLLPKVKKEHPDIRRRSDFLFMASWNWSYLEAVDLTDIRNIPLGYLTYSHGIMPFLEATALSGRIKDGKEVEI